jgi:hypothetical protein
MVILNWAYQAIVRLAILLYSNNCTAFQKKALTPKDTSLYGKTNVAKTTGTTYDHVWSLGLQYPKIPA